MTEIEVEKYKWNFDYKFMFMMSGLILPLTGGEGKVGEKKVNLVIWY
jgi:hypothetical protein